MKDLYREIFESGLKLPLVEQFYSVQGEGFHTGKPAYFIRIGGCDIGCHWCDSKVTWNPEVHPLVDVEEIVHEVLQTPAQSIVVTGGEPSLYNLQPLCDALKKHQVKTFLETAGTNKLTGEWDWICLSPKKQTPPLSVYYDKADELKVIIYEEGDLRWAEEVSKKVNGSCQLFLQPEWSQYKKMIPLIVEYVKSHPIWNISLQAHKFMRIP
ncbi:MAG: 7-carboxy-7-deazaguanine synthase QueE [Bacteroidota bacterium]